MKYKCTNCKKCFNTLKEGYKHYKDVKHEWGGLEHLKCPNCLLLKKTCRDCGKQGKRGFIEVERISCSGCNGCKSSNYWICSDCYLKRRGKR